MGDDSGFRAKANAPNHDSGETLSPGRLEALTDGIFAIVLTLLVLELHAPQAQSAAELWGELRALWPSFLSCAISFAVLGIFWFGHRMESHWIRSSDRVDIWLTLLFLACIALVPFSASLLGKNVHNQLAVAVYGANLALATLMRFARWTYATGGHRLVAEEMDSNLIRAVSHRLLIVPLLYLMAIAISSISTAVSLLLFALLPVIYILPAAAQSRHLTSAPRKTEVRQS